MISMSPDFVLIKFGSMCLDVFMSSFFNMFLAWIMPSRIFSRCFLT